MGPMIPGLRACMVDEADAVLVDEGVVPLIIARPRREDDMSKVYLKAAAIATKLDEGPDFEVDHNRRRVDLKRRGFERLEQLYELVPDPLWKARRRALKNLYAREPLVAKHCYIRGKQYEVVQDRIVIVDEYTGRFLPDRNWNTGCINPLKPKKRSGHWYTVRRSCSPQLSRRFLSHISLPLWHDRHCWPMPPAKWNQRTRAQSLAFLPIVPSCVRSGRCESFDHRLASGMRLSH